MKFVFAPDSFKGSMSSQQIIKILNDQAHLFFDDCICIGIPMADGGEGTLDIIHNICNGKYVQLEVSDPLFQPITSKYSVLGNGVVLIEMAAASGLTLIPADSKNPELTTTFGTGQLIKAALDSGHRQFIIGVGGSATNDGGIGAMSALGVRFLDNSGCELSPVGGNLIHIREIDTSHIHPALQFSCFQVMCDIDNPLLGERGATMVFGPQKGATASQLINLEEGMSNYVSVLKSQLGIDPSNIPGAGAAGGLAAGLMAFLNASLHSGISTVLSLSQFSSVIQGTDYCITGEGRADSQSAHGKVLWGVGTTCKDHNVPAIAIVGSLGPGYEELFECGIKKIYSTIENGMSVEYAMQHAEEQLIKAAARMFADIRDGR